jgi:hypothetical protein
MAAPVKTARTSATIVSVAYAVALTLAGIRLQHDTKQALSYVPAALGLAVVAFDKWLWKFPPIHRFLTRPRLDGVWAAKIYPADESHVPDGGNRGPIEAYLIIEQSYWSMHVCQYTAESTSHSRASIVTSRSDSKQQGR